MPTSGPHPEPDAFHWPPSTPGAVGADQPDSIADFDHIRTPHSSDQPVSHGWHGAIAREWFGQIRAPLHERLRDAGWTPDPPGTWCRRCGEPVGPFELSNQGSEDGVSHRGVDDRCPACRRRRLAWNRAVRVGPYAGELRTALLEAKASGWRRLAVDLGRLVAPNLLQALAEDDVDPRRCVLVPVPTPWRRVALGSIDHTLGLCRGLRAETRMAIARPLVAKNGPTQVSVAPSARQTNLQGRFHPRRSGGQGFYTRHAGSVLLVVDDIRTSGATMTAACRALQRGFLARAAPRLDDGEPNAAAPVAMWCVTVAVTEPKNRRPLMRSSFHKSGTGSLGGEGS